MYYVSQEQPDDWWEVEALYDLCFAPGREALSSYRLRDNIDPIAALCLIARDADQTLAAAIRFWPVQIKSHAALLLGPIAVHPTRQGEGLGGLMMDESLTRARNSGWERVLLVGDAPYYGRFGFVPLNGVDMPPPTNPTRILGLNLCPDAWVNIKGRVTRTS